MKIYIGGAIACVVAGSADLAMAQARSSETTIVEEVVVSARRREERLQDVPASVTSLSADRLEAAGVASTRDLNSIAPGLSFRQTGIFAQPNIRGIGSTTTVAGDEPNVATYVDGVYYAQMSGNVLEFNNIERVEVLKGPQGTLFGRNAAGGAISIITRTPTDEPTFRASASYGSFDEVRLSAYAAGAIAPRLVGDVALLYWDSRGYARNIFDGARVASNDGVAVRAKLVTDPWDGARAILAFDHSVADDLRALATQPREGNTRARATAPALLLPDDSREVSSNVSPHNRSIMSGVSLRLEQDLGEVQLLAITAHRKNISKSRSDTDFSPLDLAWITVDLPAKSFSQELQVSGALGDSLEWVVGAFGYTSEARYENLVSYTGRRPTLINASGQKTRAVAGFGEVIWPLTPRWSLTLGLRYSDEEKELQGARNGVLTAAEESWSGWTPRLIAKYEVPDLFQVYGSYSRGFKSGLFNTTLANTTPVDPERVSAFEVGLKTLGREFGQGSLAVFRYEYKDIQVSAYNPVLGNSLQNAAEGLVTGVEADWRKVFDNGLTVRLNATYVDAEYESFPNALVTLPLPGGGNSQEVRDVSGAKLVRTPDLTVGASVEYTRTLRSGELTIGGDLFHSGEFFWDPLNRLRQSPYTVMNARIAYSFGPGERYQLSVYGRNLGNEVYSIYQSTSTLGDNIAFGEPRSFGARLDFRF